MESLEESLRLAKNAQTSAETQFSQLSSTITALQAELLWTQQKLKDTQELLKKERCSYRSEEKSNNKRIKMQKKLLEFCKSISLGSPLVFFLFLIR